MLDICQIIFWSITYVLIVIASILSRNNPKVSMPYIAGVLNFSWELCALYHSQGFWGHVVWLSLDLLIVYFSFRYIQSNRNRVIYSISILISTLFFLYVFTIPNGMLFSSFIIDFVMAVCFLIDREKLSKKLKGSIAFTKLLGDLFAGMYYAHESAFVAILAGLVFFCNISYLYLCIEETGVQAVENTSNTDVPSTAKCSRGSSSATL